VILIHEGVGSAVHDTNDEIVLQEGMVFLLPAGQTATIRATPHMPIRLFSARCRESLYNGDDKEEEEKSSKEEKVDYGMILSPPSLKDLEESRAFRPIEAPLWCLATCIWPNDNGEERPIVVVGGGGGSSKTGIVNQVIVGHVGKKQGRVGLVGTFTLNLKQLPSSIAIGHCSYDEKCVRLESGHPSSVHHRLVAFNVESKLRLCKLVEGRRLLPIVTLSLGKEENGDSSDSNPIDFSSSDKYVAAASGNEVHIFKIERGHGVRVLANASLDSDVLDLTFHPSENYLAVGCSDGSFQVLKSEDLKVLYKSQTCKKSTCSTCLWWVLSHFLSLSLSLSIYLSIYYIHTHTHTHTRSHQAVKSRLRVLRNHVK